MQIPQYTPGDEVRARGTWWRVDAVRTFAACTIVTLTSSSAGEPRRLIHPFDDIDRLDTTRRPQVVSARRWRRACRRLLADDTPPGCLRSARDAHLTVMPHQLEPVMAVLAGRGTRVLLADDVGLGKTVEA